MFTHLKRLVDERSFGVPLGYMLREDQFWPTGSVVTGHSSWRSDPELAGGGALLEHTIHGCDLLAWLFGPAATVSARTRSIFGFGVEDIATAQVTHENEVVGTVTTAFNGVEGREERRLEVFFEQATVETTGDFIIGAPEDSFVIHRPRSEPERPDLGALRRELFASYGVTRDDFIFYQYVADRAFVHAVRESRPANPDFNDAWRAHAVVEAAYRSAAAGGAGRRAETDSSVAALVARAPITVGRRRRPLTLARSDQTLTGAPDRRHPAGRTQLPKPSMPSRRAVSRSTSLTKSGEK